MLYSFKKIGLIVMLCQLCAFGQVCAQENKEKKNTEFTVEYALSLERNLQKLPSALQSQTKLKLARVFAENPRYHDKAVKYALEVVEADLDMEEPALRERKVNAYIIMGNIFVNYNNFTQALSMYQKGLEVLRPWDKNVIRCRLLIEIANTYQSNRRFVESKDYINRALTVALEIENESFLIAIYNMSSRMAREENKLDSTIFYQNKILELTTDPEICTRSYIKIGNAYDLMGEEQKAYDVITSAKRFMPYLEDPATKVLLLTDAALYSALLGAYDEAEEQITRANEIKTNISDKEGIHKELCLKGSIIYDIIGDHQTALSYLRGYVFYDNLEQVREEVARSEISNNYFNLIDLERKTELLLLNNKLKQENAKKVQLRFWFIVIFLITLIIISIYIIFSQKEKANNQAVIERQNIELTKKKFSDDLHKMELKAVRANLEGQEVERERIAKELHDGVGGAIAGIKLEIESIAASGNSLNRLQNILKSISKTYGEVRSISRNLSIPRFEGISFEDNLKSLANDMANQGQVQVKFSQFPESDWPYIPPFIQKEIYRVFQEALTNILKHANAKSVVIQLILDDGVIRGSVDDDGVGFDYSERVLGIGLENIKSRINILKGTLNIDTAIGQGTFIEFVVPLETNSVTR